MKHNRILYLARHAKSSWRAPTLSDRDRPLNKRGRADAPGMGKRLKAKSAYPDLIITSPANRAQSTAALIATELDFPVADIRVDENIYGAHPSALISLLQDLDNQFERVMLVGHNPEMTDLVNHLAGYCIDNLPTCAIVTLEFATDVWQHVESVEVKLLDLDYPKRGKML